MVSFVIPAHNEAEHLPTTLDRLRRSAAAMGIAHEIIVVNDDSSDRTPHIAIDAGARVIGVKLRQISKVRNAGAAAARFDRLCFVDADTTAPTSTLAAAMRALDQGAVGGGARVRFDQPVPLSAELALGMWNSMARAFRWAAGCFVFATRRAFQDSGGFSEQLYAAEEIALSNALKRLGPFTVLPHHVATSARKLVDHSPLDHWRVLFKTLVCAGRNLRSRRGLELWYEPKRGVTEASPRPEASRSGS
jgi:glycosyltransferase involved in cell wall biosynthesis